MEKIIVLKEKSGERIDKFLMQEFFLNMEISRGEIIRNIKNGNILVNNKVVKPSYILKEKDYIDLEIKTKKIEIKPNQEINFKIIFENKNFIVIDKPAGLQVHSSEKNEQDTLVNGLICQFPEIEKVGDSPEIRPGIVHRLDRDTSGVMIVARNQETFLELKEKFKKREIQKIYLAIVYGKLKNRTGLIDASIARASNYKKQTIAKTKTKTKIRSAVTEYEVLQELLGYSLVKAVPKTGRTHQIRVHFSFLGHPIVGDEKYYIKGIKLNNDVSRHLLHAKKISFELKGDKFEFESELPRDFEFFLDKFTKSE